MLSSVREDIVVGTTISSIAPDIHCWQRLFDRRLWRWRMIGMVVSAEVFSVRGRQGNRYCSNILKKIQKNECCRLAITGERNNNSNSARTHKSLYAYKKFNWITVDLEFVSPISINKYVIVIAGQSGLMGGALFFITISATKLWSSLVEFLWNLHDSFIFVYHDHLNFLIFQHVTDGDADTGNRYWF